TPDISPLSLHDALPISRASASAPAAVTPPAVSANTPVSSARKRIPATSSGSLTAAAHPPVSRIARAANTPSAGLPIARERQMVRSEEHTSELQSLAYLV